MNENRKKQIRRIDGRLSDCYDKPQEYQEIMDELQVILDEEKASYEKMSAKIQFSEKGDASLDAQENLDKAMDAIYKIIEFIEYNDLDLTGPEEIGELSELASYHLRMIFEKPNPKK